jgi:hypothetical protein
VDLKEKVALALRRSLRADPIRLEEDGGISGIAVSAQFERLPSLERQRLIDKALRDSSIKLTKAELRKILAIAGLTPAEYEALGSDAKEARR